MTYCRTKISKTYRLLAAKQFKKNQKPHVSDQEASDYRESNNLSLSAFAIYWNIFIEIAMMGINRMRSQIHDWVFPLPCVGSRCFPWQIARTVNPLVRVTLNVCQTG